MSLTRYKEGLESLEDAQSLHRSIDSRHESEKLADISLSNRKYASSNVFCSSKSWVHLSREEIPVEVVFEDSFNAANCTSVKSIKDRIAIFIHRFVRNFPRSK